jgi:hypothetical protein
MSLWFCRDHGLTGPMACCSAAEFAQFCGSTFLCTYCKRTIELKPSELEFHDGNPRPGAVTPRCMESSQSDASEKQA